MPHFHGDICNYEYKLITPPLVTPVTLQEAKDFLKITDASEDTLIITWIEAATCVAEEFLNRRLVTQTWAKFLDRFGIHGHRHHSSHGFHNSFFHEGIILKKRPFASLTKVEFYPIDWDKVAARTSFDITKFFIPVATQGRDSHITLFADETFPDTFNIQQAILIEFTAGQVVADINRAIKQAILIIVAFQRANRGDCCDVCSIPASAKAFLQPHRVFSSCC